MGTISPDSIAVSGFPFYPLKKNCKISSYFYLFIKMIPHSSGGTGRRSFDCKPQKFAYHNVASTGYDHLCLSVTHRGSVTFTLLEEFSRDVNTDYRPRFRSLIISMNRQRNSIFDRFGVSQHKTRPAQRKSQDSTEPEFKEHRKQHYHHEIDPVRKFQKEHPSGEEEEEENA